MACVRSWFWFPGQKTVLFDLILQKPLVTRQPWAQGPGNGREQQSQSDCLGSKWVGHTGAKALMCFISLFPESCLGSPDIHKQVSCFPLIRVLIFTHHYHSCKRGNHLAHRIRIPGAGGVRGVPTSPLCACLPPLLLSHPCSQESEHVCQGMLMSAAFSSCWLESVYTHHPIPLPSLLQGRINGKKKHAERPGWHRLSNAFFKDASRFPLPT